MERVPDDCKTTTTNKVGICQCEEFVYFNEVKCKFSKDKFKPVNKNNRGLVNEIRNQGKGCKGSCWAFSTIS